MARLRKKSFSLLLPFLLMAFTFLASRLQLVQASETLVQAQVVTALKTVSGHVETLAGMPIENALVKAHKVHHAGYAEALTDENGFYELALGPGLWAVTVVPTDSSMPAHWFYPHEPQHVEFAHNSEPENHRLSFAVVAADAAVKGIIAMPDGSPPPFVVKVGLRNGEGYGVESPIDPATGAFLLRVPHGRYDVVIQVQNDMFAAPRLEPIHVEPDQLLDLGTIQLLTRNAFISGAVTDNSGLAVADMPIVAWQGDRPDALRTHTNLAGLYELAVVSGTWHLQPAPGPDMPYLYVGQSERVTLAAGEIVADVDFTVLAVDATIAGQLVTADGERIEDVAGYALARSIDHPDIHTGASLENGLFHIGIPAGSYLVSVQLPAGSPYVAPDGISTTVASGAVVSLTIPLRLKESLITGPVVDPRDDYQLVTGVQGTVSARDGDRWVSTHIRPDAGRYNLHVVGGVWHLTYDIDDPDYVKLGGPANIPVANGGTATWPLLVTRKDAVIAGQVLAPDGAPVPGAAVFAQGLVGDIQGLRLLGRADENGHFAIRAPHGRYRVGSAVDRDGWINPFTQAVAVGRDATVAGIVLQFALPNAAISGTVTVNRTTAIGRVQLRAWSDAGHFTTGAATVQQGDPAGAAMGPYHLPVLAGTVWQVRGIFTTDNEYWLGRGEVHVPVAGTTAILDLDLEGPFPLPDPVVVTFRSHQAQHLQLGDGTEIFIPAGAIPTDGEITLRVVPLATLPQRPDAQVITYGYAFFATDEYGAPIEAHFNHNVVIRFPYDGGLSDRQIRPAYFSTTTNEWTVPEHWTFEPDRQQITIEIDHFTNFALVALPAPTAIFLPLISR